MHLLLWPVSDATESPAPDAAEGKGSKSYRGIAWRAAVVVVMAVWLCDAGDGSGDLRRDAIESGGDDGGEVSLNAR